MDKPDYFAGLHLMIDIEDLAASRVDSVILEIGWVKFEVEKTADLWVGRSRRVNVRSQDAREIDDVTARWWMNQPGTLRKLLDPAADSLPLVLDELALAVRGVDPERLTIWAWGVGYDIPKLEHAFRQCGKEVPWKYWQLRCARTLCELAGVKRKGTTSHRAQDDCVAQAVAVVEALKLVGDARARHEILTSSQYS